MKKRTLTALTAALAATILLFTGCGSSSDNSTSDNSTTSADEASGDESDSTSAADGGYRFVSGGVSIGVDMDADAIVEALGEPKSTFEEASCAAQGTAYNYTYSGFEICTYPDGDNNYIAYILIKDDTVSTPEGIDLSMTRSEVIAAYGDDYTEDDKKITYEKDGMTLNFFLDGENLSSIEYDSGVLN